MMGESVGRNSVYKAPSDSGARLSGARMLSVLVTQGPCLAPEAGSVGCLPSPRLPAGMLSLAGVSQGTLATAPAARAGTLPDCY